MTIINLFSDGASRGNPGEAGIGVIIYENNKIIEELSGFIGRKTNNEAEYLAIIHGLEKLLDLKNQNYLEKIKKINIFSDSEFLIKQLKKEYKVKSEKIIPLFEKTQKLLNEINFDFGFNWVPRTENKKADELANKGIDEKNNKLNFKTNVNLNKINKNFEIKTSSNKNLEKKLILNKAFFGKINCFKIQMNNKLEIYFHMGLFNKNLNNWKWIKVKMNDAELGEIIHLLNLEEGKCSFFHSFENSKTQIWCNKNKNSFSIKIKDISKNLTIGEFEVLKIILKKAIEIQNFHKY